MEAGKGFRISAWGAAGLVAGYSITLTLALQWYFTGVGRYFGGYGSGLQAIFSTTLYLIVLSGVISLASQRRDARELLIYRVVILIIAGVLSNVAVSSFIFHVMSTRVTSLYLLINAAPPLIFIGLGYLLFPIRRLHRQPMSGERVPLISVQQPLSIRIWFVITMAFVIPGIIDSTLRIVYLLRSYYQLSIAMNILQRVVRWGFIAYMMTRLAEYSLYQRGTEPAPFRLPDSANSIERRRSVWIVSFVAAFLAALISTSTLPDSPHAANLLLSGYVFLSPLTALAALSGCLWLAWRNPPWLRWLLGIVLIAIAGLIIGWLVAFQAVFSLIAPWSGYGRSLNALDAALLVLPQSGLLILVLLVSNLHNEHLGRVPLFARKSFVLSVTGLLTFLGLFVLLTSSGSLLGYVENLIPFNSTIRMTFVWSIIEGILSFLSNTTVLIPVLLWMFVAIYLTHLLAWKIATFAPPREAGLMRILRGHANLTVKDVDDE